MPDKTAKLKVGAQGEQGASIGLEFIWSFYDKPVMPDEYLPDNTWPVGYVGRQLNFARVNGKCWFCTAIMPKPGYYLFKSTRRFSGTLGHEKAISQWEMPVPIL